MKKLVYRVLTIFAVVFAMAGSRAVAQVTITEEPDLSPEYVSSSDYKDSYNDMVNEMVGDKINERVEQAAMEQQRQILIVGGVAVAVALVLVFVVNRKPKKKRRHW